GGRVRIVSPSSVSILMTSAPMSASIRVQCGPAIVVEKSRTRRPAKLPVKFLSSLPGMVISLQTPSALGFRFHSTARTLEGAVTTGKAHAWGTVGGGSTIAGQTGPVLASDLFKAGRGHFF